MSIDWKLSSPTLADLANPTGVLSHPVAMSGYARPGFPYQVLEVKSVTRPLDVTATLVGSGGLLGINPASDTVLLQLVEDAKVQTFILKL